MDFYIFFYHVARSVPREKGKRSRAKRDSLFRWMILEVFYATECYESIIVVNLGVDVS